MIYLLHFDEPLVKANGVQVWHYLGWCREDRLTARVKEHQRGRAHSKLTSEVHRRGIGLHLVQTWPGGGRALERYLKQRANLGRHCPICRDAFLRKERERQMRRRRSLGVLSAEQCTAQPRGIGGRWLPRNPGTTVSDGGTSPQPPQRESGTPFGRPGRVPRSGGKGSGATVLPDRPPTTPSAGIEQRSG